MFNCKNIIGFKFILKIAKKVRAYFYIEDKGLLGAKISMKVLVISLSCFRKSWRQKFVFASQKTNRFTFKLVVPHQWRYYCYPTTFEKHDISLDIRTGRVAFAGRPARHFYYSGLVETMRQFRPDIIHIEHEPESLVTLEILFFRNLFLPQAKIILRTSRTFKENLRWSKIRNLMERYVYRKIDYIFCVNQRSHDFLRQQGYTGPIKIHPNGVDSDLFSPVDVTLLREKLGLKNSQVIGYAGRLVREKGIGTLIKAVAELQGDYKLLIVGDGPELSHLHEIARGKNIGDKLITIGLVKHGDMPQYLNCMDVLILPSITTDYWEEYFGIVLIEALACGVPVIGSTCGEIPNIINEKKLIFQEGQVEDLKSKLMNFFENYGDWKKRAQDNICWVKTNYSWEVLGQQIINTYNEL